MPAWCFVCDGPVAGDRCPACGRQPTVVEDPPTRPEPRRRFWLTAVPTWLWLVLAVLAAVVLFPLLRSGFHLG